MRRCPQCHTLYEDGKPLCPTHGETPLVPATFGSYTAKAMLGKGAFGVVFRASHRVMPRDAALKLLTRSDEIARKRFAREMSALVELRHSSLATIYDADFTDDGMPWIAMMLVDGDSLRERLTHGRLDIEEVTRIGACVADALAYLHTEGLIHRDVKPSNIMVDRSNHPWLLDLGIARPLPESDRTQDELTREGAAPPGTPAYQAPESFDELENVPASDVYSLGVVLYELATGYNPFSGKTALDSARRHLENAAPPTGVGDTFDRLLSRTLEKSPGGRPTAQEVADALRDPTLLAPGDKTEEPADLQPTPEPRSTEAPQAAKRRTPGWAPWLVTLALLGGVAGAWKLRPVNSVRDATQAKPDRVLSSRDAHPPDPAPLEVLLDVPMGSAVRAVVLRTGLRILDPLYTEGAITEGSTPLSIPAGTVLETCGGEPLRARDALRSCWERPFPAAGVLAEIKMTTSEGDITIEVAARRR